jgi:DNA-binding HxlR family transcriptional regulator
VKLLTRPSNKPGSRSLGAIRTRRFLWPHRPHSTAAGNGAAVADASLSLLDLSWNPLILAEVWSGVDRFNQIKRNLGISSRVLSERLKLLVERGVLERRASREQDVEYLPTAAGRRLMGRWLQRASRTEQDQGPSRATHSNGYGQQNGHTNGSPHQNGHPRLLELHEPAVNDALALLGARWNLLILGQVFAGVHRFSEISETLGISNPVLSRRLKSLVDGDILERREYQVSRYEYWPTAKGRELYPALAALVEWASPGE